MLAIPISIRRLPVHHTHSWNKEQSTGSNNEVEELLNWPTGFGSVARRRSSKPIIAAVNGHAFGGGLEMVLNCDLVVASEKALFGLPEVAVGVVAAAGGKLQRLNNVPICYIDTCYGQVYPACSGFQDIRYARDMTSTTHPFLNFSLSKHHSSRPNCF